MFVAASRRFLISSPIGLDFPIIFILPFRLYWNNFIIDLSNVRYKPGVRQLCNWLSTPSRNFKIFWLWSWSNENCKSIAISLNLVWLMIFPTFIAENRSLSSSCKSTLCGPLISNTSMESKIPRKCKNLSTLRLYHYQIFIWAKSFVDGITMFLI